MALFVGLDVSLNTTSICIVEANGKLVWEGKALSVVGPMSSPTSSECSSSSASTLTGLSHSQQLLCPQYSIQRANS